MRNTSNKDDKGLKIALRYQCELHPEENNNEPQIVRSRVDFTLSEGDITLPKATRTHSSKDLARIFGHILNNRQSLL